MPQSFSVKTLIEKYFVCVHSQYITIHSLVDIIDKGTILFYFFFSLLETMSHYTDEPRFTIEQIDLLQRLRRTGMTKHEILHALETLDRLDQEHSDKFGRRSSYGGSSYGNSTNNVPASSSTATASTQTQHSRWTLQPPLRPSTPPHSLVLPIRTGGRITSDYPRPMGRCHQLATMPTAWVRGHTVLKPQKRTQMQMIKWRN